MHTGTLPTATVSVVTDIAAHAATPGAPAAQVEAADMGGLAFGLARLALAIAGLLAVVYAVGILVLTLCAHWIRR